MQLTQRVAFIGGGNMARALIQGLIGAGTCSADRIWVSDVRADACSELATRFGVTAISDNRAAARAAEVSVLCVKPQVMPQVLEELAPELAGKLAISIAAGVPLVVIERPLGAGARVVRAMPNTPALVLAGATAISAGAHATAADMDVAESLFRSVGVVARVEEAAMDAVTALSGSGPAYVFALVEALSAAGERVGLAPETSALLAAQTVFGAGKLLHESGEGPELLRKRVSSPGGTTVAGLERLAERGFAEVIADAVGRATERGRELGREAAAKLSR